MRCSSDHKSETRSKIIASAVSELKKGGINGASIPKIMEGAGLTLGGFYAHFESRDELVAETVTADIGRMIDKADRLMGEPGEGRGFEALVTYYLGGRHADDPKHGCPLPALGADIARSSRAVRNRFSTQLAELIELVARQFPDLSPEAAEKKAMAALSTMVGAIMLARANCAQGLPERWLTASHDAITDDAVKDKVTTQRP